MIAGPTWQGQQPVEIDRLLHSETNIAYALYRTQFRYLNFMLSFAPPQDVEKDLLARFAKIGIEAGKPFKLDALTPEQRKALEDGISDATHKNNKRGPSWSGLL